MDFQLREIYNIRVVKLLSQRIKKVYPNFDNTNFSCDIEKDIDSLNFGDRSRLIRDTLKKYLPNDFPKATKILIDSLLPELIIEPGKTEWDSFIVVSETEFISKYGINHFDISMNALYEMTKRCSSEGAIRPFIRKYQDKCLTIFKKWTKDPNVHVRRLVSEGTRPRLPLASPIRNFINKPMPVIDLLESLKDDHDLYVRRSVANNLNDISKDNPDIVIKTLTKWKKNATKEREWIIRHALRTLFKRGNKDALSLMGFSQPKASNGEISLKRKEIKIGESETIHALFTPKKDQKLMIDYAISYMKSNGKHSKKVFKFAIKKVKKGDIIKLNKRHSFRQMTTRKHYTGIHKIELIINGEIFGTSEFSLFSP